MKKNITLIIALMTISLNASMPKKLFEATKRIAQLKKSKQVVMGAAGGTGGFAAGSFMGLGIYTALYWFDPTEPKYHPITICSEAGGLAGSALGGLPGIATWSTIRSAAYYYEYRKELIQREQRTAATK